MNDALLSCCKRTFSIKLTSMNAQFSIETNIFSQPLN
eukprot:UN03876